MTATTGSTPTADSQPAAQRPTDAEARGADAASDIAADDDKSAPGPAVGSPPCVSDDSVEGKGTAATNDSPAPSAPVPRDRPGRGWHRAAQVLVVVVAVLPLTALFARAGMRTPVNFDGAMNLQVATNLAAGDGYMRFYGEPRTFPFEVQTNGPYVWLAAAAIRVFGAGQLGYQLANVVFVAGCAAIVSLLLAREHLVVRLIGPTMVLLVMPHMVILGLGGVGEVPTACFLLGAVLCLVEGVRSPGRAPWWVLGAGLSAGAAVATKTFAVGAAPALALGALAVLVAAPSRRGRWQVVLAGGAVALVPLAREIHRLVSLGSPGGFWAWWSRERAGVSRQSGLGGVELRPVQTFLDHVHVLSQRMDVPAELLLVILVMPLAWVAGLVAWRWRQRGLPAALQEPYTVLVLILGALAASYIGWWLLLLPDAKLWVRRMSPGLFALQVLYLLLVPWLVRAGWNALRHHGSRAGATASWLPAGAAVTGLAAVAVSAAPFTWGKVDGNIRALADGQPRWLRADEQAADHIRAHPNHRYYGDHWWSAPALSLMSDTGFHDLSGTDPCSLDPARDRLVWDHDAKTILSSEPPTHDGTLVHEPVATFGPFVTIYAVGPAPGSCG